MALTLGVASKGVAASGSTVCTTTGVVTQAVNSTIVLAYTCRNTSTFVSVADNKGNSANYVRIGTQLDSGFGISGMFYCQAAAGGTGHTATLTISGGGGSEITLFFLEIKADTSAAFDKFARIFDAASPFTSGPTATTTTANEFLVGVFWGGLANPITPAVNSSNPAAGSWTINTSAEELDGSSNFAGCMATASVSATGAYEAGFTEGSSSDAMVHIATFADGGAVGPLRGLTMMGVG